MYEAPVCGCADTAIRRRIQSNGVEIYAVQCLGCGRMVRSVSKKDNEASGDFDEGLRERWDAEQRNRHREWWEGLQKEQEEKQLQEQQEWWAWYNKYLQSSEWKARRLKVLSRAGGLCEGCGERRATQVHHTTYEHVGNEMLWELRAVCNECHERCHEHKKIAS